MNEQLPLAISLRESIRFDDFLSTRSNLLAIEVLKKFTRQEGEPFIFLSGDTDSGKTHLIHAACHELMERGKLPVYLSLKQPYLSPAVLNQLDRQHTVFLDHLDCVLGHDGWEEALFHFYNQSQDGRHQLLVAARKPASQFQCRLPDLKSRLCHGLPIHLKPLTDAEKIFVLQQKCMQRGMELTIDVGAFLLRHVSTEMSTLMSCLDQLDQAAFVQQRKLTIPFVRKMLKDKLQTKRKS